MEPSGASLLVQNFDQDRGRTLPVLSISIQLGYGMLSVR